MTQVGPLAMREMQLNSGETLIERILRSESIDT